MAKFVVFLPINFNCFYRPNQFDVMIMTNLYGTIVSNLACGLIGGPGLLSGRNMGPKVIYSDKTISEW